MSSPFRARDAKPTESALPASPLAAAWHGFKPVTAGRVVAQKVAGRAPIDAFDVVTANARVFDNMTKGAPDLISDRVAADRRIWSDVGCLRYRTGSVSEKGAASKILAEGSRCALLVSIWSE